MKIQDWFNIHDIDHLRAWQHLEDKSFWPEGFLPEDVIIEPSWQVAILAKLAKEFLVQQLAKADVVSHILNS